MKIQDVIKALSQVAKGIKQKDVDDFVDLVNSSKKIYVAGEGRSGLVVKAFAMRLARLEKHVYVVGETVTPPMKKDELLIAVSGSGETKTILETVKICRVLRGAVVSLTANPESSLSKVSHQVILIPAQLPKRLGHIYQLRELIGVPERPAIASMFELVSLIFLEVVAFKLELKWQQANKNKQLLPS